VFSLPNIGTVGLGEEQAIAAGRNLKVFESRFRPIQLSFSDSQRKARMKLVVDADTDRMLGCHMVGPDAGEIIQGIAVAMKAGATKRHFDDTMGIHPTAAEEFVTKRTPVARGFCALSKRSFVAPWLCTTKYAAPVASFGGTSRDHG
jgi:glutathione reductase (NADPH)